MWNIYLHLKKVIEGEGAMDNSTFVKLVVDGLNTYIQIQQFLPIGAVGNAIFVSMQEFSSLMYQLKAIEKSLIEHENRVRADNLLNSCLDPMEEEVVDGTIGKKRKYDQIKNEEAKKLSNKDELSQIYAELITPEMCLVHCLGCLLQTTDHVCEKDVCFNRIMKGIDEKLVRKKLSERGSELVYVPKNILLKKIKWVKNMKQMLF